ncbi:MAG: hypothetical protein NTZ48_05620 [Candidatus Omnitrophica bacterium]|nr:hypothetical protein [Candidatus Omnitrophota bacterium]
MINYQNIANSIEYYSKHGFIRVEVPWAVTKEVSGITRPPEARDFSINETGKVLVASAEQGFLYQYLKEFLPKGRFQAVTPCFRNNSFDELHTKYFMKNELIDTIKVDLSTLHKMLRQAQCFFQNHLPEPEKVIVKKIPGETQFDIEYKGIELGSYGIRHCSFISWVYGTACAEPRLSHCQGI